MSYTLPDYHRVKLAPRNDIDEREFYDHIAKFGLSVKWESAQVCPCSSEHGLQIVGGSTSQIVEESDPSCVACGGTGYLYHSAQTITAQVLGHEAVADLFTLYGVNARGMVRVSTQQQHFVQVRDRLTILDGRRRFTEVQTKAGSVETLTFPVLTYATQTGTVGDATTAQTQSLSMLHVTAADSSGDIILDGAVPRVYELGTDFTIDGNGAVDWTGGANVPPDGSRVSYTYLTRPVFLVHNLLFASRQTYVQRKSPTPTLARLPNYADCKMAHYEFPGADAT